jgi:nitrate/nitrite transporter NarK
VGVGLTWGAVWFAAGMALLLIVGLDAADVPFPLFFGLLGFLSGATFSALFSLAERHRRIDELSLGRVSGWGALGGLLFSTAFALISGLGGEALVLGPIFAAAGAVCAGGTLALARRAERLSLPEARTPTLGWGPDVASRPGSAHEEGQIRE